MSETISITGRELDQDGRFSRFELISWWEQPRLAGAKLLVVGAGALGNEIIKNCALAGVGNVLVADMDRVENSNLSRSVLFREEDNGRYKAEVACEAARGIYPDVAIHPFVGNVVHDLGLGAYFWADVVIGGLDNREARVAVGAGAMFAGKPWVDGAIEVLNGVARVFAPGDGPCYECTMSEMDWKMLESRRSCALLTRDELGEGKVPTTPTTASVIAGLQVQEAIKIVHGLESIAGRGIVFNGLAGDTYLVEYKRKPDCMGHERCTKLERLGCGVADITVGALLARARGELGARAVIGLSRDVVSALACPGCGTSEKVYRSLGKVTEKEGKCPACGEMRFPETVLTLGLEEGPAEGQAPSNVRPALTGVAEGQAPSNVRPALTGVAEGQAPSNVRPALTGVAEGQAPSNVRPALTGVEEMTFAELGVPPFDVVTARAGERTVSYMFDGDAGEVLGPLARR